MKTRKKREKTGEKWARYGLRSVKEAPLTKDQLADRRAAFDDFGVATDMSSEQAGAGFETWEEYQRSGKQATVRLKSVFFEK